VPSRYAGQLEVHGKRRMRSWTRLLFTAFAGSVYVVTSEPVDFQPGEIVVLTGGQNHGRVGYEELTVLSNTNKHVIHFQQTLMFTHQSEIITIDGRPVDMRCQVGLLSRNVIIQGDVNSLQQSFGVHTAVFYRGIYRIENVEMRRCGQSLDIGRYCTQSHHGGDMSGSYVKANSIHHSFQRAITTLGTNNWEVQNNNIFRCFFFIMRFIHILNFYSLGP